jgi:vitamin B12 transporter
VRASPLLRERAHYIVVPPSERAPFPNEYVMMRRFLAVLCSLAIVTPATAQRADTVGSSSVKDSLPKPTSLAPLFVTVSRLPIRTDRIAFSTSTIEREDLAAHRPMYLSEALRSLSGSHIEEAAGPGGPTIVRLRGGEEVFTQILLDGVQLNENGGFFDFQGLMLGNVARIEVLRGPQSALYGSTAMSGVVQVFTPRGEVGNTHVGGSFEGGAAQEHGGTYRGQVDVSGGSPRIQYSAGIGRGFTRGTYELPHNLLSDDASLRLDFAASPRFEITTLFRFMGIESHLPVRDPGATRVPLDPTAFNERDRLVSSLVLNYAPGDVHSHSLRFSHYDQDFRYEDRSEGIDGSNYDFFVFDANFVYNTAFERSTAEYVGRFRPRASSLALSYGAQIEREALVEKTDGDFGNSGVDFDRTSGAAFGELYVAPVQRLGVLVSARLEQYEQLEAEMTPRIAATFELLPGSLMLRAAAARGYKAPNLQQEYAASPFIVSNPDLRPESSINVEAGLDYRHGGFTGGVTAFRQDFRDLIRTVPVEGQQQQINRNLGRSTARGVEATLGYRPSTRWSLDVDAARVETEIRDNVGLPPEAFPVGDELPFRPKFYGGATLIIMPTDRLTLAVRGSAIGSQWVLTERFSGERTKLDSHAVAGVTAAYKFDDRVDVHLRVENLLNTTYDAAYDRRAAPRSAALGIRVHR